MATITDDQVEELGQLADTLDNLVGATELAMPDAFHVKQLKIALPKLSAQIKALVVALGGEDPWEDSG